MMDLGNPPRTKKVAYVMEPHYDVGIFGPSPGLVKPRERPACPVWKLALVILLFAMCTWGSRLFACIYRVDCLFCARADTSQMTKALAESEQRLRDAEERLMVLTLNNQLSQVYQMAQMAQMSAEDPFAGADPFMSLFGPRRQAGGMVVIEFSTFQPADTSRKWRSDNFREDRGELGELFKFFKSKSYEEAISWMQSNRYPINNRLYTGWKDYGGPLAWKQGSLQTLLHLAVGAAMEDANQIDTARLLMSMGADPNIPNEAGQTAASIARDAGLEIFCNGEEQDDMEVFEIEG